MAVKPLARSLFLISVLSFCVCLVCVDFTEILQEVFYQFFYNTRHADKSCTHKKNERLDVTAFQLHVIRANGIPVEQVTPLNTLSKREWGRFIKKL